MSFFDRSVAPGDDFYSFANGSWLAATSLPEGHDQYGFYNIAKEQRDLDLLSLMQPADDGPVANHLSEVVQTLFASGMNRQAIDSVGMSALAPELGLIAGIRTADDLPPVLARLQLSGVTPFFKIHRAAYWELAGTNYLYLRQTSLGLADNDILGRGCGEQVRLHYGKFLTYVFQRLGEDPATAARHTRQVIALEERLAALAMTDSELRDFHKNYNEFKLRKLRKLIPDFDWKTFFAGLGVEK